MQVLNILLEVEDSVHGVDQALVGELRALGLLVESAVVSELEQVIDLVQPALDGFGELLGNVGMLDHSAVHGVPDVENRHELLLQDFVDEVEHGTGVDNAQAH